MGCLLIIAGILIIAYSYGNSFLILVGVILLIWGFSGKKPRKGGSGSSDGYDGHTHTGTGTPTSVHLSNGNDVDTYGNNWRESVTGGRENFVTGETVETDYFGNHVYTDGDGDTDDGATFEYDDD